MSFDIGGLGPRQTTEAAPGRASARDAFTAALQAARDARQAVHFDASFPITPPPEVTEAIGAASQACDELTATGQQLHFTMDHPTGALAVELLDLAGNPLTTISASEALRIAAGKSLT
jgi:hypothetical protein